MMNNLGKLQHSNILKKNHFTSNNQFGFPLDICMLSNNIMDYYIVSQGKTTIPSVDDGEEMTMTDVRFIDQIYDNYL
jgi:hypothetical protein